MTPANLLIALLMGAVVTLGLYLDRREEAEAAAFMARCRPSRSYHDCLLLWGRDTYVFEGEAM
jgi:hypothetical protein